MSALIIDEAAKVFADPTSYADEPRLHAALTHLRDLAFGYGVHFCLGAALARMEMNSFFTELLPRLKTIELNGNPELISTTFVGGLKHLPIRYQVR
jgi:cytochrome P450